ncbi:MAG: hypothetical protein KGL39_40790 [Patescibacteria group bacterium]|nr:hypothetical protein [Patescibacteria group bacterium]
MIPKHIDGWRDLGGALWTFETARYTVALFAEEEEIDPADSFEDKRDIAFARSGKPAAWFCATVAVYDERGDLIGRDVLGGCSYRSFGEFYKAHWKAPAKGRNCSVQTPEGRRYTVCHYFPSMVREAVAEARAHELRHQFAAA